MTSKLQVTLPKSIADRFNIKPGDQIDWEAAGDTIRVVPARRRAKRGAALQERLKHFDRATERQGEREKSLDPVFARGVGTGRSGLDAIRLIQSWRRSLTQTSLAYRYDPRFPEKQRIATETLRRGIAADSIRVPHQAVVEFVAVLTRPLISGRPLLQPSDARREAEEFLSQFTLLFPNENFLRLALRAPLLHTASAGSMLISGRTPSTTVLSRSFPKIFSTTDFTEVCEPSIPFSNPPSSDRVAMAAMSVLVPRWSMPI